MLTGMSIGLASTALSFIFASRVDFSFIFDQIINNLSKWYFMYGGQKNLITIRMIIGRLELRPTHVKVFNLYSVEYLV